ncbi:MAG: hypothetical protein ABSD88_20755 [Candidatus Korobacteraceae bacterium]
MFKLTVSFEKRNARLGSKWLFSRRHQMRLEWLALLTLKSATESADQTWVSLEEIARLPHWAGKSRRTIGMDVGRYVSELERRGIGIIKSGTMLSGPYRLIPGVNPFFDVPLNEVKRLLRIRQPDVVSSRQLMAEFTHGYVQAQSFLYSGRLTTEGTGQRRYRQAAYGTLLKLATDRRHDSWSRLLAGVSAASVLQRLGRYEKAVAMRRDQRDLLRKTNDPALKAYYYLTEAAGLFRSMPPRAKKTSLPAALRRATAFANESADKSSLGWISLRTGLYLARYGRNEEAIDELIRGLRSHLLTDNYNGVQLCCGNIGSIIHRIGERHYAEARDWLTLAIDVAAWMHLGSDDAHAEMIMAKIETEEGNRDAALRWLKQAETIAEGAANQISLADVKVGWALWHQHFGKQEDEIEALVGAVGIYSRLRGFDFKSRAKYLARIFPEVWNTVLERRKTNITKS